MPIPSSAAPPASDESAPATQSTATHGSGLEDLVKGLKGRILGLYWLETTGEFVVNYGGQSVKKASTIREALGSAKANHDALVARKPTIGG